MSEHPLDDATVLRAATAAGPAEAPAPRPAPAAAAPDLDAAMQAVPGAMRGNALVRVATPLLLLAVQLLHSLQAPDIAALREGCCERLHRFEDDACRQGADPKAALAARYALCTLLDEAVLASPWGEVSGWSQRTLLVTFHGETYGGAKVFDLLDRLVRDPARHLELLELLFLALALGFGGRYLVEPGGQARLADRQAELHRLIQRQRAPLPAELSPQWRGADAPLERSSALMPLAIATVVSLCLVAVVFLLLYARLNRMAAPISAQLAGIGMERATLPRAPAHPAAPVSLVPFLEPEQRAGLLTVGTDADGRSTIRISSAAMFVSGGTEVDPRQHGLLRRIAAALQRVPGRVLVIGHTDDQPVRSLRIKDNYALSTLRAENVGALLAAGLSDPRRIETSGAGDSQPLATPPQLAENRARNRRVEIVLIPEG
ncbi:type VI secretion system protein TssL, long form [Xanthomonas translucens]|uniref:type VI secretion system protein TssL, long form n=1 Tax=Xanthomonas campestris pv. translucens TaxID=343 RepID=UPI00071E8E86|nr:type VI secretion system protein TssL, long form [Xanthomonas translucens]KTF40552.1 membrane protein [Xanthomonas translucens pv. translucens]MCT8274033.1 type VI secretion system protein TssL, long form [Xanthomonas translucens pv. translucens]MCT8276746.1 type VI secretion system protein TssL, long form [Xanthomonas translucens pv. translucens]MCT8305531.1 type VI secretion system protein TssL, long form [Xanthomonas translucens pv. translucens]WNJ26807.1 type VI secretion system protein